MTDPVSEELARGAAEGLPWRPALAIAIALHLGTAVVLLMGPTRRPRPLMLPSVQVRIGPLPMALPAGAAASTTKATAAPARAGLPVPPLRPAAAKPVRERGAGKEPSQSGRSAKAQSAADRASIPAQAAGAAADRTHSGPAATAPNNEVQAASSGGGIAVGPGENGAGANDFPYGYYLSRALATIETNWFKPPGAAGTRCRVICRIDRSGRLIEAGLSEPSAQPAFDRAALRAVYAAAPFPPLPQGYASPTLTLHLEFGP